MATPIPDLWPQSFGEPLQPPPVAILRQQGLLLGQRTDNLVYGEVKSRMHATGEFAHVLDVVAPFLAYRQPLAVAYHHVDVYPAKIGRPDLSNPVNHRGFPVMLSHQQVRTADEFMEALKSILQAEDTVKLVQTLISQSAEPTPVEV